MTDLIEQQRRYYNNRWSQATYINEFQLLRLNAILEAITQTKLIKPRILDFGCGTGWLTSILNHIGPATGIELSDSAVKTAKEMYPGVQFINGNLFEYPFQQESFDLIVSQEVIEHVEDQETYITLIAEYLRKGGYLILTTPNALNFNYWTKMALENWNLQPIENWLTIRSIKKILHGSFEIIYLNTIIAEFGSKGAYRILNSMKLNKLLDILSIKGFKDNLMLKMGLGLHIVVLAKKRNEKGIEKKGINDIRKKSRSFLKTCI